MNKSQRHALILARIPVLYHGTDARILDMTEPERKSFHEDCKELSKSLWPLFEPYVLGQETVKTVDPVNGENIVEKNRIDRFRVHFDDDVQFHRFTLAVSIFYRSTFLEDTLFEHDSLYFTSFRQGAERYAHRAGYFGEIGFVAYHLADATRRLNYEVDDSTREKMDRIVSFAEDAHHPVVVEVNDYDPDQLRMEGGENLKISKGSVAGSMFRYLGNMDLNAFPAVPVTEAFDLYG